MNDIVAIAIDHLALLVHHIVELQRPLAREIVPLFDPLLRRLDAPVQPWMLQLLPLFQPKALHDFRHPVRRAEIAHQVILEAYIKARCARVALPRAAPPELPVNPPRLVPLGSHHIEPAGLVHARAQFDVCAAARHVRGNSHASRLACPLHDLGLLRVEFRVEHAVWNFLPLQHPAQHFGGLDAGRSHQHRLAAGVRVFDLGNHRVVFFAPRLVDEIVVVLANARLVGGDDRHVQLVDVVKFVRFGFGGARHARQLEVEPEIILDGDRRHRLRLPVNLNAFLRLDGLMKAVAPAAPGHLAPGELIDDDDFVIFDHVFDVFFKQAIRPQQLRDVMNALSLPVHVLLRLFLLIDLLRIRQLPIVVDLCKLRDQVGEHEGVGLVRVQIIPAHLREIRVVSAFVDDEKQLLLERVEPLFLRVAVK